MMEFRLSDNPDERDAIIEFMSKSKPMPKGSARVDGSRMNVPAGKSERLPDGAAAIWIIGLGYRIICSPAYSVNDVSPFGANLYPARIAYYMPGDYFAAHEELDSAEARARIAHLGIDHFPPLPVDGAFKEI